MRRIALHNWICIYSTFLLSYGVLRTELLRLEYISTGLVFASITFGIGFIPLGVLFLAYRVRRADDLPHFYLGLIGNSLNTMLFFALPLFFAVFVTRSEWHLELNSPLLFISTVEDAVLVFLSFSAAGMIMVPAVERLLASRL